MNFIKGEIQEIFIFQATVLKFHDLLGILKLATNAKCQHNISKIMPVRPKNRGTWGVNTIIAYTMNILLTDCFGDDISSCT